MHRACFDALVAAAAAALTDEYLATSSTRKCKLKMAGRTFATMTEWITFCTFALK